MEKDRVEILQRFADIKAESKMQKVALERSSETVPELKMLLERSEQQRGISSLFIMNLKHINRSERRTYRMSHKDVFYVTKIIHIVA